MKKLPTLRGRTVVNLFFESSTRTSLELRARGEAALGGRDVDQVERLVGGQGRVAEGHGADAERLRPRRDRHPPPAHRRAEPRRARDRRARRQRRRRQAPAPDAGAARPVHDRGARRPGRGAARRDRRRRAALPGRPLEHPGADADGRARDARRAAAADPARDRGDGLRGLDRHRRDPARRRRLRPAHAARADGVRRELRPLAARVLGALGRDAGAPAARPEGDAPRPDEPRRRDRPGRRRLGRRADRDPGARRPRRAGWPCSTTCSRRARSRSRSRRRWRDAPREAKATTTSSSAARE